MKDKINGNMFKGYPRPVKFEQANVNYIADGCGDLPAYKGEGVIMSCWRIPFLQRLAVVFSGKVYVSIFGNQQPPINVLALHPFKRTGKSEKRKEL